MCRPGVALSCWSISTAFPGGRYEMLTPDGPFTIKFETSSGGNWLPRFAFDEFGGSLETVQVDLGKRREIRVRLK